MSPILENDYVIRGQYLFEVVERYSTSIRRTFQKYIPIKNFSSLTKSTDKIFYIRACNTIFSERELVKFMFV